MAFKTICVDHIGIACADLEAAAKIYTEVLGLEITNKEEVNKPSNLINMSKLQEFYEVREKLQNLGIIPNADFEKQLAALEEENIKNEIVPMLTKSIEPVLKLVKREITLIVEYNPEDGVCVNLLQKSSNTTTT